MGDWYETVVDVDATADDAAAIGRLVLTALVGSHVVQPEPTDCTLGEPGYPPGAGAFSRLRVQDDMLGRLRTNGLEISVGRSAHVPVGLEFISCPSCRHEIRDTHSVPWGDAISEWYDGGVGTLACPACATESPITAWHHTPNAAFGHLAFTFWNWPPFEEAVWHETPLSIIRRTTGHRCELVAGKL